MCWLQKSNIGDLQLSNWKKRKQQDYKAGKKTPRSRLRYGKTKTYFNKPSKWLERMIVRDQENVFLFRFGLIVPAVLKYLFWHNLCRRSLPTWRKVIPIYSFLLQSKICLMHIMWNILAKGRILKSFPEKLLKLLKNSSHFDIYSFVQISRNLGYFARWKMCYILGNKPSTPEKF